MRVAIIPARGGSKRIPRKNVREFRGRPMLAWSVEAALTSGLFDTVMVSTDDEEIAAVAIASGADVPFMRSADAANDHATTATVISEVLASYSRERLAFDQACCLYATAPLATPEDLADGLNRLLTGVHDVVMPVVAFDYPIWRSLRRDDAGGVALNYPEHLQSRSQDLPTAYHDAGQWYWLKTAAFEKNPVLIGPATGSIVLTASKVQDIDTEEDWIIAEMKHRLTDRRDLRLGPPR